MICSILLSLLRCVTLQNDTIFYSKLSFVMGNTNLRSSHRRRPIQNILQNSTENTCARASQKLSHYLFQNYVLPYIVNLIGNRIMQLTSIFGASLS